jgi:hypothetical protein
MHVKAYIGDIFMSRTGADYVQYKPVLEFMHHGVDVPSVLQPGDTRSAVWTVFFSPYNPFQATPPMSMYAIPEPGTYWFEARSATARSQPVQVIVTEPQGDNAAVWQQIRGDDYARMVGGPAFISIYGVSTNSLNAIESVLRQYPNTTYAPVIASGLGRYFKSKGNVTKTREICAHGTNTTTNIRWRMYVYSLWIKTFSPGDSEELAKAQELAQAALNAQPPDDLVGEFNGIIDYVPFGVEISESAQDALRDQGYYAEVEFGDDPQLENRMRAEVYEVFFRDLANGSIRSNQYQQILDQRYVAWVQQNIVPNIDHTPPQIDILLTNPVSIECGTTYTDAGATATDNKDGDITASITVQNNVNPTVPGAYTVVYTVSDAAGNSATATRTVNVVDTTAPVLTCLNAQVHKPDTCGGGVNFAVPTALDQCAGSVAVTCSPASGDVLAAGVHTVNCSATDPANNPATCSFTVDVKERLQARFVAPLSDDNADNNIETDADVVNTFKVGSRVINKVKLFDCAGNDVTEAYASLVSVKLDVTLRTTTNTGSDVVNDVPEVSSGVGNAGGLMIPVGDHFQYNLDTTGYATGTANDERFYRSAVTVEWVSAPGLVVGGEDALLESKP